MWQQLFPLHNAIQKYISTSFCRQCFTSPTLEAVGLLLGGGCLFILVFGIWICTQYFCVSVYRWLFVYTLLFLILKWGRVLISPEDWIFFGVILYHGRSLCMCFRSYLEYLLEDFVNFDLGLLRDPCLAGRDILICFMLTELSLKLMWAVTVCWFALCSLK